MLASRHNPQGCTPSHSLLKNRQALHIGARLLLLPRLYVPFSKGVVSPRQWGERGELSAKLIELPWMSLWWRGVGGSGCCRYTPGGGNFGNGSAFVISAQQPLSIIVAYTVIVLGEQRVLIAGGVYPSSRNPCG
jgi:hypothetical protein